MANLTEDELSRMIRDERLDERERCRLLVKMRGDIARKSATRLRAKGSYTARTILPLRRFGQKFTAVKPEWEKAARDMDAVAEAFYGVASGIERGWDPRTLADPDERVRIHPAPMSLDERLEATKKANGL